VAVVDRHARASISIVPGRAYALFTLTLGDSPAFELVPVARFAETLSAFSAAARFGLRSDAAHELAELLPWAGNV
jgi:hypothetical protein